MAAFTLNLKIDQGATFSKLVTWKVGPLPGTIVDLTDCIARMQARGKITDSLVLLDLSTENGGILLGGSAGTVEIKLSASQTAAFKWVSAVYDLEIEFPNGDVRRLLQGTITVSPEVTRA